MALRRANALGVGSAETPGGLSARGGGLRLGERLGGDTHQDARAAPRPRAHAQHAAEVGDALAHADQTEPGGWRRRAEVRVRVEAAAVVLDLEEHDLRLTREPHVDAARRRVLDDVGEPLLEDAEE